MTESLFETRCYSALYAYPHVGDNTIHLLTDFLSKEAKNSILVHLASKTIEQYGPEGDRFDFNPGGYFLGWDHDLLNDHALASVLSFEWRNKLIYAYFEVIRALYAKDNA